MINYERAAILLNQKSLDKMTEEVKAAFEKRFHKPPVKTDGGLWLYYTGFWMESEQPEQTVLNFLWGLDAEDGETVEFCKAGHGRNMTKTERWSNSCESDSLHIHTDIEVDGIEAGCLWA